MHSTAVTIPNIKIEIKKNDKSNNSFTLDLLLVKRHYSLEV